MTFSFTKPQPANPAVTEITATTTNSGALDVTDFSLQVRACVVGGRVGAWLVLRLGGLVGFALFKLMAAGGWVGGAWLQAVVA